VFPLNETADILPKLDFRPNRLNISGVAESTLRWYGVPPCCSPGQQAHTLRFWHKPTGRYRGVRSGGLGSQTIGPPRTLHRSGNIPM